MTTARALNMHDRLERALYEAYHGDRARAVEALRSALALNPRSAEAWAGLAYVRAASGDPRGALRELEEGASRVEEPGAANARRSIR